MLTTLLIAFVFIGVGLGCSIFLKQLSNRLLFSIVLSLLFFLLAREIVVAWETLEILTAWLIFALLFPLLVLVRKPARVRLVGFLKSYGTSDWIYFDAITALGCLIYTAYAGPYLEVPADVFFHLGEIRNAVQGLEQGQVPATSPWYLLLGLSLYFTNDSFDAFLYWFPALTMFLFLLSVRVFAGSLLPEATELDKQKKTFVAFSVIFSFLLFGTSVFSFARYYSFAPVGITFPIFLLATTLVLEKFGDSLAITRSIQNISLFIGSLVACLFFHKQEGMFLLLYASTVLAFGIFSSLVRKKPIRWFSLDKSLDTWAYFLFLALGISTAFAFLLPIEPAGIVPNNTIGLFFTKNDVPSLVIGDPLGRSFETIGFLGVIGILVYLHPNSRSCRSVTLTALIAAPLLTVFNPLFVALFSSLTLPSVLWRMFYMVPVGVISAILIVRLVASWNSIYVKLIAGVTLLVALFSPLPDVNFYQFRLSNLLISNKESSPGLWSDLIKQVRELGAVNILTDPVTGYVLTAMTNSNHDHRKFQVAEAGEINKKIYGATSFLDHAKEGNWYFIVNLRNGKYSEAGDLSGHWSPQIMNTAQLYSVELLDWLGLSAPKDSQISPTPQNETKSPKHFRLIWRQNGISLYSLSTVGGANSQ